MPPADRVLSRSDLAPQPGQVPVTSGVFHSREQLAADDLVALADLGRQDALFFQQGKPHLRQLRVIAGRPLKPVPFGLLLLRRCPRLVLGHLPLELRLEFVGRFAARSGSARVHWPMACKAASYSAARSSITHGLHHISR
jgi:hypothetical protein